MGLATILGAKQRVQFIQANKTVITFDCSVQETHARESLPTEFPIENGTTISDNIWVKPFTLDLQGIISDTPLDLKQLGVSALTTVAGGLAGPVGVVGAGAGVALYKAIAQSKSPSVAAYGQLLQLQASKQPFDVLTTLQRYPNMYIKSLSVPRDASTGQILLFTVSLIQLVIASPQTVNIAKYSNPTVASPQADAGKQQLRNEALSRTQTGVADGIATERGISVPIGNALGVK